MATEMLKGMNFDIVRLGDLKANFQEVEPVMRNTDFLSFDISAIQFAYAEANVYSSPNGLNGEEACKIMRYAGVSDKLSAVGLFEYNQELDVNNQTAQLLAQMIWYFIDGYKMRKQELNPNLKNCIKYTVAFEDGKNEIIFYKSQSSGRWWMGVPFKKEGKKQLQNYFVACSYRDYEVANQGEVPERWLKTYNKFI
jgi:formiminoglutamase